MTEASLGHALAWTRGGLGSAGAELASLFQAFCFKPRQDWAGSASLACARVTMGEWLKNG
ncbi:hypothetical protein PSDT_1423 [Parascardovia denticolens DSM 10105 = JCM 12538]|nr:hypothetical protein PSDT_1423 [Parascardovia denticolens DSM 10105 = JCM 12538]